MNIRKARAEDIPYVVNMGIDFIRTLPYTQVQPDVNDIDDFCHALLGMEDGLILVLVEDELPVGTILAASQKLWFSKSKVGMELAWWVNPDRRGDQASVMLPVLYLEWAKQKGCSPVHLSSFHGQHEKLHDFYTKLGFTLSELNYFKEF